MRGGTGEPLFVIHRFGAVEGGARWRQALDASRWPGPALAPDLPGHGAAPAPAGGYHEPSDLAIASLATIVRAEWGVPPVVVGERTSSHAAELLAAGARAGGMALVDGLGGPWPVTADDALIAGYAWARALAADPGASAPPPSEGPDPRLAHGLVPRADRVFAERFRQVITVPVLVIETPASPTPPGEVAERAGWFAGPVTVQRLDDGEPEAVLAAVAAWWSVTSAGSADSAGR